MNDSRSNEPVANEPAKKESVNSPVASESPSTETSAPETSSASNTPVADSDSLSDRDPIDLLAEEFVRLHRSGTKPSIDEFADQHPDHSSDIRELFPLIVDVERLKTEKEHSSGGAASMGPTKVEQVGDYRIIREIGRGGMGVVYEAEQLSLRRRVALKVLGRNVAMSERQQRRFQIEAESAASLHHTNIVPVYGVGESDGLQFIAMQLIDGLPLSDVITGLRRRESAASGSGSGRGKSTIDSGSRVAFDGRLVDELLRSREFQQYEAPTILDSDSGVPGLTMDEPPSAEFAQSAIGPTIQVRNDGTHVTVETGEVPITFHSDAFCFRRVAEIGASVADALAHAHLKGILHRDIKPGNLLLDRQGVVWVSDFGLAKTDDVAVTRTGDIVGTLRYMAPEQFGGQQDARSEVYSLGLTLYELLTLKPAWDESQHGPLIQLKATTPPARPRSINRAIPRDLETIVLKAIAIDPQHRYETPAELAEDLRCFVEDRPIQARRVSAMERTWRWTKRNPLVAFLSAATVMSLAFVAIVFAVKNEQLTVEKQRATNNLNMAVAAFEDIIEKITTRAIPRSLVTELESDTETDVGSAISETIVTPGDAELLESLLEFFNKFAANNPGQLGRESAMARWRVGDIKLRLGRLEEAVQDYQSAYDSFAALEDVSAKGLYALERVTLLNETGKAYTSLGDIEAARREFERVEQVVESAGKKEQDAPEIRFQLAKSLYLTASAFPSTLSLLSGPGGGRGGPGRGRGGRRGREGGRPGGARFDSTNQRGFPRFDGKRPDTDGDAAGPTSGGANGPDRRPNMSRFRGPAGGDNRSREADPEEERRRQQWRDAFERIVENTKRAQEILAQLLKESPKESPKRTEYQVALAACIRTGAYLATMTDAKSAIASRQQAIDAFDQLCQEYPESNGLKFELVETLLQRFWFDSGSDHENAAFTRLQRANSLAEQMLQSDPSVPEYRALTGQSRFLLGRAYLDERQFDMAHGWFENSLKIFSALNSEYPSITKFRAQKAMNEFYLSIIYRGQNRLSDSERMKLQALNTVNGAIEQSEPESSRTKLLKAVRDKIQGKRPGPPGVGGPSGPRPKPDRERPSPQRPPMDQ